jgi:hypothetical protein
MAHTADTIAREREFRIQQGGGRLSSVSSYSEARCQLFTEPQLSGRLLDTEADFGLLNMISDPALTLRRQLGIKGTARGNPRVIPLARQCLPGAPEDDPKAKQ